MTNHTPDLKIGDTAVAFLKTVVRPDWRPANELAFEADSCE
jgi:hypothetical protein